MVPGPATHFNKQSWCHLDTTPFHCLETVAGGLPQGLYYMYNKASPFTTIVAMQQCLHALNRHVVVLHMSL